MIAEAGEAGGAGVDTCCKTIGDVWEPGTAVLFPTTLELDCIKCLGGEDDSVAVADLRSIGRKESQFSKLSLNKV